jgi:hypothetical protein
MGLDLDGLYGSIALSLPLLALATLMIIAVRTIGRRRRAAPPTLTGRYGVPVEKPRGAPPPPAAGAEQVAAREVGPQAHLTAREIARRITEAEARGAEADLAGLYLALARDRLDAGSASDAAALLLKSIRLAAKLGQKEVHAAARLELGDLAREQGDLTTACEHWQMARGLFYELKSARSLAGAEQRMRSNGCPTDWVLNDF